MTTRYHWQHACGMSRWKWLGGLGYSSVWRTRVLSCWLWPSFVRQGDIGTGIQYRGCGAHVQFDFYGIVQRPFCSSVRSVAIVISLLLAFFPRFMTQLQTRIFLIPVPSIWVFPIQRYRRHDVSMDCYRETASTSYFSYPKDINDY